MPKAWNHTVDFRLRRFGPGARREAGRTFLPAVYAQAQSMPLDTTTEAQRAQVAAYRRMQPGQRVALAVQMSDEAREIAESGIRARCPHLSREGIRKRLLRTLLGETLYLESGIDERR